MKEAIDVRFTKETWYQNLGRNRYSKPTGIRVKPVSCTLPDTGYDEMHLFGLNSKGAPTEGLRLVVPRADLAKLRDALNVLLAECG